MEENFVRILMANLIDFLFIFVLMALLTIVFPLNDKAKETERKLETIFYEVDSYTNIEPEKRLEMFELSYEFERSITPYYLLLAGVMLIYFIIYPKKHKNQTYGERIMKIRLTSEKEITYNTFIVRALLTKGLALVIIFPLMLYFLNAIWYSNVTTILILIQIVYWLVSFLFVIFKKETLHDKLTNTKIIEVKR